MIGEAIILPTGLSAGDEREQNTGLGLDGGLAIFILIFASLDLASWVEGFPILRFVIRAAWWVLYLAVVLRLIQRFGSDWIGWLVRRQTLLTVILGIALLSTFWSLAPLESLRTAASLMATTFLGVYIGYSLSSPAIAKSLSIAFSVVIVASLLALPTLPASIVIEPFTGQWQGLMDHKNTFGALAALGLLFYLAPLVLYHRRSRWRLAMCGACGLALLLSRSVTALIACVVGVGALVWPLAAPRFQRAPRRVQVMLGIAFATAIVVVGFLVGPITEALGRDATFNGRTRLWAASLQIIRERPLTGYGYAVVWHKGEGTLLPHIPMTADEEAASAHNLVLNVATELGVPAAVLLVAYMIGTLLDAARSMRHLSSPYPYVTALLVALVTLNITESYLLGIHYVFWILWVAMAVMLRRNAQLPSQVI